MGDSASATVIQWHVIAMFAPSFFTGSIINFLGNRKVMMMGVLLYIISICFGIMGQTIEYFWISLFLCGLGWNFLYVGGSDIIAKSALPEERAKVQGVTDFIIFIFVASGSFLAGSLHNNLGWEIMMFYTSIPISILFLSIVFINPREIKQPSNYPPVKDICLFTDTFGELREISKSCPFGFLSMAFLIVSSSAFKPLSLNTVFKSALSS